MFLGTLTGSKNERETKKRHGVFFQEDNNNNAKINSYTIKKLNQKIKV
jgi:hypothetical protein